MSKGIYTALSGALAQARRVESIANNLANSQTNGYKRDDLTFKEHLTILKDPSKDTQVPRMEFKPGDFYHLHGADKSFATVDAQYTDYSQGPLKATGRQLDVALQGRGFFEVATPKGVRFTRNGVFNLTPDGQLVDQRGYPVLSKTDASSPESYNDPNSRAIQLGKGKVHVADNGDIFLKGQFVASIQITQFNEPTLLKKEGNNLFHNTEAKNVSTAEVRAKVLQNHVEGSNVNPVAEMVNLLEAQRSFQMNLNNIKQFDTIQGRAVNDIGKF